MRYVVLFLLLPVIALATTATQTDWSGGDDVPGPVTDWVNNFDWALNVIFNEYPGELLLPWVPDKHIVDNDFSAVSVYSADIDGDNDTDILGGSYYSFYGIAWWENDGSGGGWTKHLVDRSEEDEERYSSVHAADLDGDGDADICDLSISLYGISWWENDGTGGGWIEHIIDESIDGSSVYVTDLDGDEDNDVLCASWPSDVISWFENDGSGGGWIKHFVDSEDSCSIYAADVDGDEDNDILGTCFHTDSILWWENDGSGGGWIEHIVDGDFNGAHDVFAADVDGDEDLDIIGAAQAAGEVAWWENDGSGGGWTKHIVEDYLRGVGFVHAADLDDDGDNDVIGATWFEDDIYWWENDGSGGGWMEHLVDSNFDAVRDIYAADVDGDRVPNILSSATFRYDIAWWGVTDYSNNGFLYSSILDTGEVPYWGQITWQDETPEDTSVTVKVRASDDSNDMGDWVEVTSSGDDLSDYIPDELRYFQYKLILYASSDNSQTPTFEEITIEWTDHSGVELTELTAGATDEGILVNWRIEGDSPSGLRVLRSVGDAEPVTIHDNPLPGSATSYLDRKDKGFQPLAGMEYRYWLEVTGADGTVSRFGPTEPVTVPEYIPELILYAAYPNPSRETINFVYSLPEEGLVELTVYDLSGRRVATLVNAEQTAGRHEIAWNCGDVESGVYLYRLETGAGSITQRLVVSR